jgi:hypothetical protein
MISQDFTMINPWFSHDFPGFSQDFPRIFPWFSDDFPYDSMVKGISVDPVATFGLQEEGDDLGYEARWGFPGIYGESMDFNRGDF